MKNFDNKNFNTKQWNPLGNFIHPGQTVLLKPNFVFHEFRSKNISYAMINTHGSLIRVIIDYCIIALKGKGSIIIGDAPLQSCDFSSLIKKNHIPEIIEFYESLPKDIIGDIKFNINDFRAEKLIIKIGPLQARVSRTYEKLKGDPNGYKIVNLKNFSCFYPICKDYNKYRVTDYNPSLMKFSHNLKDNKYLIAGSVLKADIIIQLPKMKTHQRSGITGCLKNNVGINGRKDWLPHHRKGSFFEGGDEYLNKSLLKKLLSVLDKLESLSHKNTKLKNIYYISSFFRGITLKLISIFSKDSYLYGGWWGNNTLWRTILDLNKILFYSDKNGKIQNQKQRKVLYICDGIFAGDKEGPLNPHLRKEGIIIFGVDPAIIDLSIAEIIGFDYKKIPCIKNSFKQKNLKITEYKPSDLKIFSNVDYWNNKQLGEIDNTLNFEPSSGWKGKIEKKAI